MIKRVVLVSLILISSFFLFSCAAAFTQKHLNEAERLERKGDRLAANNEYIRALRGVSDNKLRSEICKKIGINYSKSRKFSEAIKYLRLSVDYGNFAGIPSPYPELADAYMSNGQPGAAGALIDELDRKMPPAYLESEMAISKVLGSYYLQIKDYGLAEHYYNLYKDLAAKKGNNELAKQTESQLLTIKKLRAKASRR